MRYGPDHKERTHGRILDAAARLFRKQGYAATGVDEVMESAGMTAGGFYSHFRSKRRLLVEALDRAFDDSGSRVRAALERREGAKWPMSFANFYLSSRHRDSVERGCPMPALAADVARVDPRARDVFEKHLRRRLAAVGAGLGASSDDNSKAIATVALCLGGLMLARAVKDTTFSDQILESCRTALPLLHES